MLQCTVTKAREVHARIRNLQEESYDDSESGKERTARCCSSVLKPRCSERLEAVRPDNPQTRATKAYVYIGRQ